MENKKCKLDKYFTIYPEKYSDWWDDIVCDNFSESFYNDNVDWIKNSEQFTKWADRLLYREYFVHQYSLNKLAKHSAKIIERAFKLYKIKK